MGLPLPDTKIPNKNQPATCKSILATLIEIMLPGTRMLASLQGKLPRASSPERDHLLTHILTEIWHC